MIRALFTGAAVCALAIVAPANAETLAVTGGKLVIGDGSAPIDAGTVIIRDGRVVAAGRNIAVPADARRIDAAGKWVTPGIFAGFGRLGLSEVGAVDGTNDISASRSEFSAAIDVSTAINPRAAAIAVTRSAGITRALVAPAPSKAMFAGRGAIIDTGDDPDAVTVARAFQFVVFGEAGASEAGGSRAAAQAYFRNALAEAIEYQQAQRPFAARPHDAILKRADMIALLPILSGGQKLVVRAESATDIRAVIGLKADFPALDIVIVGAAEGWIVAKELVAANIPVIASALTNLPATFEMLGATQSNIGRMRAAGVRVSIGMLDDNDAHQLRYTPQYAGNLVGIGKVPRAAGLSWDEAFAAISSGPADALGVGDRLGSLRPGRVGDVVIWDGDPLELSSKPVSMFIDGIEQSLADRQDRLRDRYRDAGTGALPKAYER